MKKRTVSNAEILALFPSAELARKYIELRRWPKGVTCPSCNEGIRIRSRKDGFYRCNACKLDFTVRTGTIFERSHLPLHKWLHAIYFLLIRPTRISGVQLSKEIGITQKSAWFMRQRIREACQNITVREI